MSRYPDDRDPEHVVHHYKVADKTDEEIMEIIRRYKLSQEGKRVKDTLVLDYE
jgi:hypothetical protein